MTPYFWLHYYLLMLMEVEISFPENERKDHKT